MNQGRGRRAAIGALCLSLATAGLLRAEDKFYMDSGITGGCDIRAKVLYGSMDKTDDPQAAPPAEFVFCEDCGGETKDALEKTMPKAGMWAPYYPKGNGRGGEHWFRLEWGSSAERIVNGARDPSLGSTQFVRWAFRPISGPPPDPDTDLHSAPMRFRDAKMEGLDAWRVEPDEGSPAKYVKLPEGGQMESGSLIVRDGGGRQLYKVITGENSEIYAWEEGANYRMIGCMTWPSGYAKTIYEFNGVTGDNKTTFLHPTEDEYGVRIRQRVTVREPMGYGPGVSPGDTGQLRDRYRTTIIGYYGSEAGEGKYGRMKFEVTPEGVARYLEEVNLAHGVAATETAETCPLDDPAIVTDDALKSYASVWIHDYANWDGEYVPTKIEMAKGCGGCGGGQNRTVVSYGYGLNPSFNPASQLETNNTWRSYRRICRLNSQNEPTGLRTVEFCNPSGGLIFLAKQEMVGETISSVRIEHNKFDAAGQVVERRHVSACVGYQTTVENGWVVDVTPNDAGTAGIVTTYGCERDPNYPPAWEIRWEKTRNGTSPERPWTWVSRRKYAWQVHEGALRIVEDVRYPTFTTDPDASDRLITQYEYGMHPVRPDTVEFETITHPSVSAAKNGKEGWWTIGNTPEIRHYYLDEEMDLYWNDWTMRTDGSLVYTEVGDGVFDLRRTVKRIEDPDIDRWEDFRTPPAIPPFSRLPARHRITTYAYRDDTDGGQYGTLKETVGPDGRTHRSVEMPINRTVDDAGTARITTVGDLRLSATDDDPVDLSVGSCVGGEIVRARGTGTTDPLKDYVDRGYVDGYADLRADLVMAVGGFGHSVVSREDSCYDANFQLIETRQYHQIPWWGTGSLGVDYGMTRYRYDEATGRRSHTIRILSGTGHENAVEDVTQTMYDQLGRETATWRGTSPASEDLGANWENDAANLALVSLRHYDQAQPGTGSDGVGEGNVTEERAYTSASEHLRTVHNYDWRNRRTATLSADNLARVSTLDNLGRETAVETYASATLNNGAIEVETSKLRAKGEAFYDEQGRVWKRTVHEVDPATGAVGDRLTTLSWFDGIGRAVKTADGKGLFQKTTRDGMGWATAVYTCFDADETTYEEALTVDGDTVIEQTETVYADATGLPRENVSYRRHENGTGEGALTTANARPHYTAQWHDAKGRLTHTADYGDNGGAPFTRPETPPEPNTADEYIVSKTEYDEAGRAYRTTDNKGIATETTFDAMGRTIRTIEAAGLAEERWTLHQYDGLGNRTRLIGDLGRDDTYADGVWTTDADSEVTRYLYEDPASGNLVTSLIRPDSEDTDSSGTDQMKYQYNRQGQLTKVTDPRGVARDLAYDNGGRLISDTATTVPSGTDTRIRRYDRGYSDAGMPIRVTGYRDTAGTQVDHETRYEYGAWGNVTAMRQAHAGAVDGNTPAVVVEQEDGAAGGEARYLRERKTVYPNGRQVYKNYGLDGVSGALSRLEDVADGDGAGRVKYVAYGYLGAGTVTKARHPGVIGGLNLEYGADGVYPGFDRYGRIVEQTWKKDNGTVVDGTGHTYDRKGNRTERRVEGQANKTEVYGYDGLGQLIGFERACPLDTTGLNGYWKLDETAGTTAYDASAQQKNGTLNGGAAWTGNGRIGGCLTMDGVDDSVSVANATAHKPGTKKFAVGAWVKTTASGGMVVCKADLATGENYELTVVGGKARFAFTVGGVTVTADSATTVSDGQWHHILGYRSGNCQGKIYVDGVWESTASQTAGADVSIDVNTPFYIGRNASGGNWFAGCVDEVRFYYNVAMSGETIAALGKGDRKGWELDGIGNWTGYTANGTAQNRTHNLGNELTKINGSAAHVQHDGAGNMTWAPKVGSEGTAHWTVTWDAWNRPATVKSGTTLTAEYRYDGEGRRIAKLRPNGSNWRRTDYYYDGEWRVVEERHAESQADKEALPALVKCQYVWDARYLDACAVRWRDGNNDGDFLDANEMLYYTHDAHFNVTALVNASGTVQERYAYEAYGRATICDGRWVTRSSSSYDNQVSFSGYRWDPETALYHVRHRTYHPTLGRWVSRDPIGERGGVNLYNFVFNDPAGTIDLTGLAVWLHLGPGNTAEKAAHFDQVKTRIDTIRTALLANAALHKDDKNWTFYFDGEKKDYFTFKTLCEREKLETKMTSAESPEGDAKEVQTTFGKHEYPYDVTFYWYHSYAELAGDPKVPEPQWIYMVPYVKKQGADRVVNRVENDTVEKGLFPHECG